MILRSVKRVAVCALVLALALPAASAAAQAGPAEAPPEPAASRPSSADDPALDKALEAPRAETAGLDACLCAARKAHLRTRAEELKRARERTPKPAPTGAAD